jgi:hypothetical protein
MVFLNNLLLKDFHFNHILMLFLLELEMILLILTNQESLNHKIFDYIDLDEHPVLCLYHIFLLNELFP